MRLTPDLPRSPWEPPAEAPPRITRPPAASWVTLEIERGGREEIETEFRFGSTKPGAASGHVPAGSLLGHP